MVKYSLMEMGKNGNNALYRAVMIECFANGGGHLPSWQSIWRLSKLGDSTHWVSLRSRHFSPSSRGVGGLQRVTAHIVLPSTSGTPTGLHAQLRTISTFVVVIFVRQTSSAIGHGCESCLTAVSSGARSRHDLR